MVARILLMNKHAHAAVQHERRKEKCNLLCSLVMLLLPWELKIALPLNANQWANAISQQSSVNTPCQIKSRTFQWRAATLESLADYRTAHKNSLERNFPLGSLDIFLCNCLEAFSGEDWAVEVLIIEYQQRHLCGAAMICCRGLRHINDPDILRLESQLECLLQKRSHHWDVKCHDLWAFKGFDSIMLVFMNLTNFHSLTCSLLKKVPENEPGTCDWCPRGAKQLRGWRFSSVM